jgi:hypothetical protein
VVQNLPAVNQSAAHFQLYGNRTPQQVLAAGHAVETYHDEQTGGRIVAPSAAQRQAIQGNPSRYTLLSSPSGAGPGLIQLPDGSLITEADLRQMVLAAGYPPDYEGEVDLQLDDGSTFPVYVSPS